MIKKAVIDRFEGKQAVILVEEKPMVVQQSVLPGKAKEGDWLQLDFKGETIVSVIIDAEETERTKERIAKKLDRLRKGEHKT